MYLNNLVEQVHRNIKRRTGPMLGFKSCRRAQTLLAGIELVQDDTEGATSASRRRVFIPG